MMTAKQVAVIRQQLQGFVEEFAQELGRSERRHWCGKYLEGLLREGERKSIEPLAARVGGDDQALQQFVNQSPWEHAAVLHRLRQQMGRRAQDGGVLVLDDTSLPKQGRHSVGVARQYCGALGKIANCQSIVTWHWTGAGLHWPLAAQLYLPAEWTDDPARMNRAGVPAEAQRFREKWRIALALFDEMKPQLPAYEAIVFDAGYGVVQPLLAELEKREEPYLAQVPGNLAAWPAEAVATPPAGTAWSAAAACHRARSGGAAPLHGGVARPASAGTEALGAGAAAARRHGQRPGGGPCGCRPPNAPVAGGNPASLAGY
jgi:SRSO17 transposase